VSEFQFGFCPRPVIPPGKVPTALPAPPVEPWKPVPTKTTNCNVVFPDDLRAVVSPWNNLLVAGQGKAWTPLSLRIITHPFSSGQTPLPLFESVFRLPPLFLVKARRERGSQEKLPELGPLGFCVYSFFGRNFSTAASNNGMPLRFSLSPIVWQVFSPGGWRTCSRPGQAVSRKTDWKTFPADRQLAFVVLKWGEVLAAPTWVGLLRPEGKPRTSSGVLVFHGRPRVGCIEYLVDKSHWHGGRDVFSQFGGT